MKSCVGKVPGYNPNIKAPTIEYDIEKALHKEADAIKHTAANDVLSSGDAKSILKYFNPNELSPYLGDYSKARTTEKEASKILKKIKKILGTNLKNNEQAYKGFRYKAHTASMESTEATANRRLMYMGQDTSVVPNTYNPDFYPLFLNWLKKANKISSRLRLPGIRAFNDYTTAYTAEKSSTAASMGDGNLNVSSFVMNKLFELEQGSQHSSPVLLDNLSKKLVNLSNQIKQASGRADPELYKELFRVHWKWTKANKFNSKDSAVVISNVRRGVGLPNNADWYYSEIRHRILSMLYHEYGHHIHQQYAVNKAADLKRPQLEALMSLGSKKPRKHLSIYSKSRPEEWFAESFSYWAMDKYEGVAPLGKSENVLDPLFISIMNNVVSKAVGLEKSGKLGASPLSDNILKAVEGTL